MQLLLSRVYFWSQFHQAGLESVALAGRVLGGLGAGIAVGVAAHGWSTTKPMQILNSIFTRHRNGFDLQTFDCAYDCSNSESLLLNFFGHFTFHHLQVFFSSVNFFVFALRDVEGVSVLHGTKEACARKNRRGGAVFGVPGNLAFSTPQHSELQCLEISGCHSVERWNPKGTVGHSEQGCESRALCSECLCCQSLVY